MRLFLLPISARRTLIYCDTSHGPKVVRAISALKPDQEQIQPQSLLQKATDKASTTWSGWEKADGGWKKTLTSYGNAFLRRIPYQEWGLKSLPPWSTKLGQTYDTAKELRPIDVLFPGSYLPQSNVVTILQKLATERQELHRKRMIFSAIGAPLTLPFALIPVLPNIPGFYLLFRAYSHFRAYYGSKHLEELVSRKLISPSPSKLLDQIYADGLISKTPKQLPVAPSTLKAEDLENTTSETKSETSTTEPAHQEEGDILYLNQDSGSIIANAFETKSMAIEIERAVEQVQKVLKEENKAGTESDKK